MVALALVVQWIGCDLAEVVMQVRFLPRAPRWKSQCLARALPALGDQIVRSFRDKKKFQIPLKAEKKNFYKDLRVKK
jgi:hypothetical protein